MLCSVIVSLALLQIFSPQSGVPMPEGFFIWPPFAFYRALGDLNQATYSSATIPYKMSMLVAGDEVWTCMLYMIGMFICLTMVCACGLSVSNVRSTL